MTTPKLPPPPRKRPEEIGVLRLARRDEATVGQHDVGLEQIVDGQPQLTGEMADAAAEGDAADPGGGDDAAGGGQPEGMRRVVQFPQLRAPLDTGGAGCRVDADPVHRGEIDDQPVVDRAQPWAVVPTAADGHDDVVVAREVDRGDDVGDV